MAKPPAEGLDTRAYEREIELARFRSYRSSGSAADRDAIVADAQGLVIALSLRFQNRGAELDDLIQVGQIGLLLAVERFDPDRGVPFVGFATPTILGELRRHFRTVWSVHMPRSLQEATQLLGPAIAELHHEHGRSPTITEIAVRTGLSDERVLEAMEAGTAFRARSLDAPVFSESGDASPLHATLSSTDTGFAFDLVDAQETIDQLLPLLSPRTRRIVELRFYEERSQTEIAALLGISQMHVSRLLRQALDYLATVLRDGA